ncbi:hypothetical protein [Burkholderia sp. BCC1644]|uniref:hypothetical protein n=1 Tax=Burkholderia sp. BCC1644 TaxID=2676293 RepID=UPI0015909873|nr:hypothetical protein [Burkholderia sp. BCC1644]
MAATERITMTMRELDRFKVIQDVADGKLKPWRAAERLELTTRQIRPLVPSNIAPVRDATFAGLGLAYLPEEYVRAALASGQLVEVLGAWCKTFEGYHSYYPLANMP